MKACGAFWDDYLGTAKKVAFTLAGFGPAVALYDAYDRLIGINDASDQMQIAAVQNGEVKLATGESLGPVDRVAEGIRQGTTAVGTGIGAGLKYAIIGVAIIAALYAIYNIEAAKRPFHLLK